jgi:glycosyltransferase involved in cell wall biosynthesis
MLAAVRAHLPFVVTFHSGGYDLPAGEQIRWAQHLVLRPLLLKAKKLITVSDWERREMSRALRLRRSRFVTIPNGAAIAAPAAEVAQDPCLIVSVGRLHRYKGHQYAIAAMPYLLEAMPGIR